MIKQRDSEDLIHLYFRNKTVAIIGYDEQGYQHAKKLREMNAEVLVVLREGTEDVHWKKEGFEVISVWEAVDRAHILQVW
ncbi:NAD(P)-dependent oxidoreductase [Domibacillus epiphyticus]|uniref:KARI N-terminal Rossmann domain-containing protein n=1 Tax=Domibacillus epiphyticus TaxID=1714355 RepID=A0A1V2ACA0_9BACI|nr:NAD(P)-dependent oxidoreductase [Domibacillus epiphyticus]OMP68434.1 hypothetical protein BTO28_02095 [Domibacillus epiphyticus]